MPDIKTALNKALNEWTKDDPAAKVEPTPKPTSPPKNGRLFATTNNVTRETFDYVLKHPGCTRTEAVKALVAKGFKDSSVHSLLGQMVKQGMIAEAGPERRMMAVATEYRPLKASKVVYRKVEPAPKRKYARKAVAKPEAMKAGVAALVPQGGERPALTGTTITAEYILDTMPIKQARALYDELKKIFG